MKQFNEYDDNEISYFYDAIFIIFSISYEKVELEKLYCSLPEVILQFYEKFGLDHPNSDELLISHFSNSSLKIYLDDERETPKGWIRAYWPDQVIKLIETYKVSHVSLDHDLGNDSIGTGYDVVLWIEEQVVTKKLSPPEITVHSANTSAKIKMEKGIKSIYRYSENNRRPIKGIQQLVVECFEVFGRTPLKERLSDVLEQAIDLSRSRDMSDMKNNAGDLLASVIALVDENGWTMEEVIDLTRSKIMNRKKQYSSLGRRINVAILGGSFNPIHVGHIQAAEVILNASGFIDEVWLIPCNNSLYGKQLVSGEHRLEMCRVAAAHDGRIKVCDWEIKNNSSGETHHLLKQFLNDPEFKNYKFHFAIGMDNAYKCPKWVNWEYVEQALPFVVLHRKGIAQPVGDHWFNSSPHVIIEDEDDIEEMSSSEARQEMKMCGVSNMIGCSGIDDNVFEYIKKHELY